MFECALIIAPFWQQCKMSITHCTLCRNLNSWKRYCVIEGRSPLTMKGRKTTFPRKERCMFRGLPSILQGYSFLKEAMPFLQGKLQLINDESKVYFDMKVFMPRTGDWLQEFKKNSKQIVPKQNSEKIWCTLDALLMHFLRWCTFGALLMHFLAILMHFWCTFQKCFKTASRVHQNFLRILLWNCFFLSFS